MSYKKNIEFINPHFILWQGYWIILSEFRELINHFA